MRAREFLAEAVVNNEKYLNVINQLLQQNGVNLQLQPGTTEFGHVVVDFYPARNQTVTSLSDQIIGTINGKKRSFAVNKVFKSDAIKNIFNNREAGTVNVNKGELAEGYHATAAFARLIKRPLENIDKTDILRIIDQLTNGQPLVLTEPEIVNTSIADRFELVIKLKPAMWEAFKDHATVEKMGKIMDSIIVDANHESSKFAERFATNEKYDVARVIGDGVTDETSKKTDVSFENEREQKFRGFSIKTLTKQVHQVGGGTIKDGRRHSKASPEERFNILANNLFAVDGRFPLANIESVKPMFVRARSIEKMQQIAYQAAVQSINQNLQTDNQEKQFLKTLISALKYWIGRDDPEIQIKQFTDIGTFIFDTAKVDNLLAQDQLDLIAKYSVKDNLPKIIISDNVSNKSLVTIRTYRNSAGYIRNYIEKEKLWSELMMVKHIPNQPVAAPAASTTPQQPVPTPTTPQPSAGVQNMNKPLATSKIPMGSAPT
jgi:hypothetical protein